VHNYRNNDKKIKCLIWDLDNTLWKGILVENDELKLAASVINVIKELDKRGILLSIASKNYYNEAMKRLEEFGLDEYFLVPQINWNSKSSSIEKIAELLNISLDTVAFIDDQQFEREEVRSVHKKVRCYSEEEIEKILAFDEFIPNFLTEESSSRRQMYKMDIERNKDEDEFIGTNDEFIKTLKLKLSLTYATKDDLQRVEELTLRTSQLNTTGLLFSYEELESLIDDERYKFFVVDLEDRYGTYGKIGLILINVEEIDKWRIKLFILSCRVMSRGIGNVLINLISNLAAESNCELYADFNKTDRNRIMLITYKLAGFKIVKTDNNKVLLKHDLNKIHLIPDYIEINY